MRRRSFLALPALVALPALPSPTDWRTDFGELRYCCLTELEAAQMQGALRIPIRPVLWRGHADAFAALHAGQAEFGVASSLRAARAIEAAMGGRIFRLPGGGLILRTLPPVLVSAISEAWDTI